MRLAGEVEGLRRCSGSPLLDAEISSGVVSATGGEQLWRLTGEVTVGGRPRPYDQVLVRCHDGALELRTDSARLRADIPSRRLTVEAPTAGLRLQLVTTYGLPLLLETSDALVLHACAAIAPNSEEAIVVCARSGTGKSTLLLALLDAGWRAVSEDVCVLDLREGSRPRVWPGPPWLRRAGRGPVGSRPAYELADKTAWDISPVVVDGPVPVARIVFMEPAGGEAIHWSALDASGAIEGLVSSAIRLSDPKRRAELTFGVTAAVALRVEAARLRMPVSDGWAAGAEETLRTRPAPAAP